MKRILFVLGLISMVSIFPFFAQEKPGSNSSEAFAIIPELEAEENSNLNSGRTKAVFKSNVKNAMVFLNGNLQGRTNLSLLSLVEGYYLLRVEKEGYETCENFIYIENSKAKTFYVEMKPDEETQKKLDARQERAAQREAEKAEKTAKNESEANPQVESTDENLPKQGVGDAK